VIIQTEPVSERSKSNVAEKVRAMAASNRPAATEAPGRVPVDADDADLAEVALADAGLTPTDGVAEPALTDVDLSEPTAGDAELPEPSLADIDTDAVSDAADLALELAAAGEGGAPDEEAEQPSNRRRARRGSTRRRTRP